MTTFYFALHVITMAFAAILIGANLSLLHEYWQDLARWFIVKIFATTTLLVYIFVSASYGHPDFVRIAIALIAIVFDGYAIRCMWQAIAKARTRKIVLIAAGKEDVVRK